MVSIFGTDIHKGHSPLLVDVMDYSSQPPQMQVKYRRVCFFYQNICELEGISAKLYWNIPPQMEQGGLEVLVTPDIAQGDHKAKSQDPTRDL